MEKTEEVVQANQGGKFLLVSVDSTAGSVADIWASERNEQFDSLEEAMAAAYWDVYLEREFDAWARGGGKGEQPALSHKEELPPPWFIEKLEEEKRKIKEGRRCTSEVLYIYDPDGKRIEVVAV